MRRASRRTDALRSELLAAVPRALRDKVERDHWESDAAFRRRRRVVGGVSVLGAGMLGTSLSTEPGSKAFYGMTLGVAGTYTAGAFASGPLHLGWEEGEQHRLRRPLLTPVAMGVGAFGLFYGAALVARRIPVLNRALTDILAYADQGSAPLVTLTTFANGAAEEVFFRGALYAAAGTNQPVAKSTAVYALATTATRNPALVLASGVMGALFGLQRRATGGIQAPMLTHLTWSGLMLRFMPPLFRTRGSTEVQQGMPPQT
ncbi:MAG: family intrarane metalloprotease [Aeromicrobium sp.]|jgi:membrane protease YdiL (CAAX protease family)|uniref:CPBP family intramembrane glutamic endopeptidase n=1 Tax=Aeromicrobium sp. TaxID=1871063 RepID=UPI00263337BC|nr:CPBP family intramembrane glutamic endopeptidase [Aeromicrobium sp.]MCW2789496.1 family intrarane metalloprotease [Aeromicrobium sp.]MCW2823221.1 family intrarane metalloprotease [Aeromicrobium sp.]